VAQITLYLADELALQIRAEAKKAKTSVSAYMAGLVTSKLSPRGWPPEFLAVLGTWEGDFPEPDDPPPDEIEPLD